jgi:hypothetical protein
MQTGLSLFFILMASNVFAAENLNLNEGKVRVIPAIMMISLLILL